MTEKRYTHTGNCDHTELFCPEDSNTGERQIIDLRGAARACILCKKHSIPINDELQFCDIVKVGVWINYSLQTLNNLKVPSIFPCWLYWGQLLIATVCVPSQIFMTHQVYTSSLDDALKKFNVTNTTTNELIVPEYSWQDNLVTIMALLLITMKTATDVHQHVKVMYFSYLQVEISRAE